MHFGVLGPLEVRTDKGRRVQIPELKVRALLADLLIQPGQPVPAWRLIDDLWGTQLPANPSAVLRSKISQLRRVLRDAGAGADPIVYRAGGYALEITADAVDAHRFETLVARARAGDPRQRASTLAEALALWRGPAYVDFAEQPFATGVAARLEEQRLTALEDEAELRFELGEQATLMGELTDLVSRYPLRERFRAVQMRALYRLGRQTEALASFRELRERLQDELGVEPGPELAALHQAILKQDPALGIAPAVGTGRRRTNLPAPITELIGRDGEIPAVRSRLAEGRLVTLVGPGGVGKTRLALEAATGLADGFPDGVWLVELAALDRVIDSSVSMDALAERVTTAIGLREDAPPDPADGTDLPAERLARAMDGKRMLLVLDNCEHVVGDVAELTRYLLQEVSQLHVLATSQEPLGVAGELVQEVPPLDLPDPESDRDLPALARTSAIRLFLDRAAAGSPGFALDADNAAAVVAICRRLDGVPLALELAATRVRAIGVHQLAAGLDDRFHLLASGRRGAPARQQTLQATMDWSWEPLTEAERALLRRLSVHADGCTLAAAEAVCSGGGVARRQVPDLLARLVDRSLVVMADQEDGPRYRLLESVGAYCLQRLREAGELSDVQGRHIRYYTALAEQADQHLRDASQREWLRRLDAETANLRAALQGCLQRADASMALRLTVALAWYWMLRGRVGEGHRSLAAALDIAGPSAALRATAMTWQAGLASLAGQRPDPVVEPEFRTVDRYRDDPTDPAPRARAALLLAIVTPIDVDQPASADPVNRLHATFRALGDPWGEAAALAVLAFHAQLRGDFRALRRDATRALELFRELGDHWGILQATNPLAALSQMNGDYEHATRWYAEGLGIAQELGLWTEMSLQLNGLGRLALLDSDYRRADELHERARKLAAEESVKAMEQLADIGLAASARRQGRLDDAEQHLLPWLEWNRKADWPAGIAAVLAELGAIAEHRGDAVAALALHEEGYAFASRTAEPRTIALALEGIAGARVLEGKPRAAARLLGAAAAARESVGVPLPPAERRDVERVAERARAALGGEAFEAELKRGTTMHADSLVRTKEAP